MNVDAYAATNDPKSEKILQLGHFVLFDKDCFEQVKIRLSRDDDSSDYSLLKRIEYIINSYVPVASFQYLSWKRQRLKCCGFLWPSDFQNCLDRS